MFTKEQAEEIFQALRVLPPEKIPEVIDYVLFLKTRYGTKEPEAFSGSWSDEDLHDLSMAVWQDADQAAPWEEKPGRVLEA